jgi:glycerol-3-phosphate dehydrogenase
VVWSERLCVEVVLAAHADGAKVYTYCQVDGLIAEGDTVAGVRYTDRLTGETGALRGRIVVNAAGPWVDAVLAHDNPTKRRHIGGTKGSHAVVGAFPGAPHDVVYYESQVDGRLVLVIPWGTQYLIGTTDLRFEGDPETARAEASEIAYLLGEVNRLIPQARLRMQDVLYTYSGIRPLPFVPDKSEWNVPRSHVIHDHAPEQRGLLSIIGGKLTTYRSLAEEAVDVVFRQLGRKAPKCMTARIPFVGARTSDWPAYRRQLAEGSGLGAATIDHLVGIYGSRAGDVLALGQADPALLQRIDNATEAIGAELVFTYRHELARTLTDVLVRRTMLSHNAARGLDVVERAADIMAPRLGWDRERRDREVAGYRRYVERFAVPDADAAPPASTNRSGQSQKAHAA